MQIIKELLTPNKFSRPQSKLDHVTNIVIHWVGNAGSSAKGNRDYFESLKTKGIYASSHYIIGLLGEIIMCVPENEIAYHAKDANGYSIGIENCHPDWTGKFNDKTYASLIELCADICKRYNLNPLTAMIRHYDVTKKDCPHYYVQNEEAWKRMKEDVKNKMNQNDNVPSAYAKDAWEWGKEKKLVDGTMPKEPVTREQLMCILQRFSNM